MILDAVLRVHYRGGDDSMAVLDHDTIRLIRRKTCVHISHNNRDKHSLDIAPAGIHTECIRDDRFHGVTLAFVCPAQDKRRGALLSSAGSALKSHLKRSQLSVVTEWMIAYGASESFRQTHQMPPMRAPHNTTKAVRVNMGTAGECSIRAASQQNFLDCKSRGSIPKKSRNTLV
jgi:hypothetical protein